MHLRGTAIDDTASEAFTMHAARLIVTADDAHWLDAAVHSACGYGTSIIGCDCEAGRERALPADQTPDGRPGAALLFFARSAQRLIDAVRNRTGQCLMTAPTTAVYDGLPDAGERFTVGRWVRFFGDGFEQAARRNERHGYIVPVMSGEFFCESDTGRVAEAVGGGTILVGGDEHARVLDAARQAVEAIALLPEVITPFPAGVCRSGSKAGARTRKLIASTNDPYCPTLRGEVVSKLPGNVSCVYEIVIDGLTRAAVVTALRAAVEAAAGPGVHWISSAAIGGTLGEIRIPLRELIDGAAERDPPG